MRMAGALCTGAYPSCLLLYFNSSCGMLTPLLNVNMKTIEGNQRKRQGAVDKSLRKYKPVLWSAMAFIVPKIGPIHQALVGLTASMQAFRRKRTNF